ncbi:MAG TPA: hypothetical protein VGC89_16895, partial [Pyrinomonadaceae bacterium]
PPPDDLDALFPLEPLDFVLPFLVAIDSLSLSMIGRSNAPYQTLSLMSLKFISRCGQRRFCYACFDGA